MTNDQQQKDLLLAIYCPSGKEALKLSEDLVKTNGVKIVIPRKRRLFTSLTELSNNSMFNVLQWSKMKKPFRGGKG